MACPCNAFHGQESDINQKTDLANWDLINFDLDQISHMRNILQHSIELLKKRVKENLETINHNQSEIRQLLKQPLSPERTYYIDKHYDINKVLLNENNDFINLQLTLLNFLDKYKDSPIMEDDGSVPQEDVSVLDDNTLFEMTIQGKLNFDLSHPRFSDEGFFRKLLSYYAATEAYEQCETLMKLKGRLTH